MVVIENLDHISLGTSNLEKSIAFYSDILDCEVIEKNEKFALLELDRIIIKLNYIPDYKFPIKNPAAFTISFNLDVDDFTNAIIELEEKKIPIVYGPIPVEGGETLLIKDPDGHWIELKYKE
jgi:catechol 2,3-dioxygenase-like lactoylglutathione lyase family enzyme